jgi:photosystem II stability/assembly factor-like uncharacterized protein
MKKSFVLLNIILCVNLTFGQFLNIEYHDVFSTGPDNAWVVGEAGTIIHTTDGGMTWNDHSYPTDMSFFSVSFADELNGFVIGGNSVYGSDSSILIRTTNCGATWSIVDLPGSSTLRRIHFVDELHGWITNYSGFGFYKTTDGGNNWDFISYFAHLLNFIDPNIGWRVVSSSLDKTYNGGLTWTNVSDIFPSFPRDIKFIDEQHGIYVGNDMGGFGHSYKTIDGGLNWEPLGLSSSGNIYQGISLADLNNGWIGGGWNIAYSSDFFETWEVFETWPIFVNSLSVHGYSNGWAVGWNYESSQGVIWKLNGYNDWVQIDIVSNTSLVSQASELEFSPNPFTDDLRIKLKVDQTCRVNINVLNSMGQLVAVIEEKQLIAGTHRFSWNASGKPSGMYFLNLKIGDKVVTRRVVKH